ncbi:MAG: hypothetical protein J6X06_02015 [Elusimicrobiaceae bacterium]|nr:hypothetical protein [Elusimicrobiaceae bacterium]
MESYTAYDGVAKQPRASPKQPIEVQNKGLYNPFDLCQMFIVIYDDKLRLFFAALALAQKEQPFLHVVFQAEAEDA